MENKPTLVCAGSFIHSSLYHKLTEFYKIAFYNEDFGRTAVNSGFPCSVTDDLVTWDMKEEAKAKSLWMTNQIMNKIKDGWVLDEGHEYLSGELLPLWLPPYFNDRATQMITKIFGLALLNQNEGIAGILCHEDVTAGGKSLAAFGVAEDIPTLHLAHANHFIKPGTTDIHCDLTSHYLGASGTYMKDWYIKSGIEEDKITLIGVPQWDQFYNNPSLPTKDEGRRAFGLDEDDMVLCFAATWPQMLTAGGQAWARSIKVLDETYQCFLETAKSLDAKVIIKIHPTGGAGREDYYKEHMEKNDVHGAITRSYNDYAIAACDCVVTQTSSNFAFEAIASGRPAVELYTPGSKIPNIPGTWGEDLEEVILQAIADGPSKEAIREMNYDNDGKALLRAVDWVREKCS